MQEKRGKNGSKDSIGKLRLEMDDLFKYYNNKMHELTNRVDKMQADVRSSLDSNRYFIRGVEERIDLTNEKINIIVLGLYDITSNLKANEGGE